MTWRSSLPLQFNTSVAAFVADDAAVTSMLTWQVPSPADAAKQLLEHHQERMIVLAPEQQQRQDPMDLLQASPGCGGGGGWNGLG